MRLPQELQQRFEVRRELGRGGMGVVFAAHDRQLGRDVALKLLHGARGELALERFRREGELTARLRHPGIVTLHSAGSIAGVPYLAYELVPGARTLDQVMLEQSRARRLELVRDVALALGHAHGQGVVHRDLKPSNVLVDAQGRVKVADFGLAAAGDLERLTQTGAMLGTPGFMAPEQLEASEVEIEPATDVWALGVLLYAALTDELPFTAGSPLELAARVAKADAAAPSTHDPSISGGLDAVCLKALQRAPGGRYPDGGAFAAELDACLSGSRPSALVEREGRRRWRWLLAGILLLVILSTAAFAVSVAASAPTEHTAPKVDAQPAASRGAPLVRPLAAEKLLDTLSQSSDPARRLRAAERLLVEFPGHPERERALKIAQRLGRERPLWTARQKKTGEVHVLYTGEGGLLSSVGQELHRWRLPGLVDGGAQQLRGYVLGLFLLEQGPLVSLDGGGLLYAGGEELPVEGLTRPRFAAVSTAGTTLAVRDLRAPPEHEKGYLLSSTTGRLAPIPQLGASIKTLALSPDGGYLVTCHLDPSQDNNLGALPSMVVLWEVDGLGTRRLREHPIPTKGQQLLWSARRRQFVVGAGSGQIYVFDLDLNQSSLVAADASPGGFLTGLAHSGVVRALALDPDERLLYSGGKGNRGRGHELRCWDLDALALVWSRVDLLGMPTALSVSPNGSYLAVGTHLGEVQVWLVRPERLALAGR